MDCTPFIVRSAMLDRAGLARRPYGQVHLVKTSILDCAAMSRLADEAYSEASVSEVGDIDSGRLRDGVLQKLVPSVPNLHELVAEAVNSTGVYGASESALDQCRLSIKQRMEFLASVGASFHNDCFAHWTRCLFWVLALDAVNVEFVVSHLGVRMQLEPGDLVVFDPSLPHGVCRPGDNGRFVAAHFEDDLEGSFQAFLSGELMLNDEQWAALGSPWLQADSEQFRNAVDLMSADIDSEVGAVTR